MTDNQFESLMDDTFEELTLVLGGLFEVHAADDELVWDAVRSLDAIRAKTIARLRGPGLSSQDSPGTAHHAPHPAVEEFLLKLRHAGGTDRKLSNESSRQGTPPRIECRECGYAFSEIPAVGHCPVCGSWNVHREMPGGR